MGKDRSRRATAIARRFGRRAALPLGVVVSLPGPWRDALAAPSAKEIDTGPDNGSHDQPTPRRPSPSTLQNCRPRRHSNAGSTPTDGSRLRSLHRPTPIPPRRSPTDPNFEVRAVDRPGAGRSPATHSFTVDTTRRKPRSTRAYGPTADNTPKFASPHRSGGSTFECRVDGDPFGPCSGPGDSHIRGFALRWRHILQVQAVDRLGNVEETPPSAPSPSTPSPEDDDRLRPRSAPVRRDANLHLLAPTRARQFECRVDGGDFAPCSGPGETHTTAATGRRQPRLPGPRDRRRRQPDPVATCAFTIDTSGPPDTTAPDTNITKKPKDRIKTKKKKARVEVAFSSEPGAAFRCKLDKAKYEPCTSPYSVKARSKPGKGKKHAISVRAIDSAGNVGEPVVVGFKVVRKLRLKESVAERTVVTALQRHGFAKRVVKAVNADCSRRAYSAFSCRFSGSFPGYRLKGRGEVELRAHLSYRFRVKAQGVRLTLTDRNESG